MKRVGDIYPRLGRIVYPATVYCTKKIAGYCMASHMRTSLVCDAINITARNCPHTRGGGDFSLRPRIAIHVGRVLHVSTEVRYPPLCGPDRCVLGQCLGRVIRSEEHTSELQSQ